MDGRRRERVLVVPDREAVAHQSTRIRNAECRRRRGGERPSFDAARPNHDRQQRDQQERGERQRAKPLWVVQPEKMRMDAEWNETRQRNSEVVERLESRRTRDAEELPRTDGGGDGDECRERGASEQQNGDRDGSRDHPEENATRELGAHTSMISASFALINSSIL